ncbi:la-related protein Larp4B-like [Lucilia sericata]|uniref:la-related protein Larp4B-like n=1 Tax=Lucilia sericata TaxID=13632 RepID=UPI0018A85B21|nr:la-related protein Larp4B-like [Lucilia sericata]
MYGNYAPAGSPPLPDIIGQYYSPGYGGPGPYDLYGGPSTSAGYLYDPAAVAAGYYGQTSPIRRRRYSIAGLPSASMMNDYYGYQPVGPQPLHQSSSSNIINLLNEAHKSISRSSQILGHHARLAQAQQAAAQTVTPLTHYPGRVISSYPTLHPGDTSPPYLNDNLMQMSASFSSQPNMYFQQYTQPPQAAPGQLGMGGMVGGTRLRPAYSVSNLNYLNYPSGVGVGVGGVGLGGSKYATTAGGVAGSSYINPYSQTLYNPSDVNAYNVNNIMQQRNLMSSLHASNPAISQLYQQHQHLPSQQQQHQQQQQQYNTHQQMLAHNIQQQFAGTQHYAHQIPPSTHPSAHIHASVQQQLNPDHQFHIHQHQNHLQTHPLAALASTTAPFPATLTSSALHDVRSAMGGGGGGLGVGLGSSGLSGSGGAAYDHLLHSSYPHHHLQHTHSHMQHPLSATTSLGHSYSHHPHHMSPYSKIDLDYPKLPQEQKRQVSFKFDVDTLSLDS